MEPEHRRFVTAFTSARHLSLSCAKANPVHAHTSHILRIHRNIILPSKPGSHKWPVSQRFPHQYPVQISSLRHTCYIPRYILLDLITRAVLGEEYRSKCSFLHSLLTLSLLGPNILLAPSAYVRPSNRIVL